MKSNLNIVTLVREGDKSYLKPLVVEEGRRPATIDICVIFALADYMLSDINAKNEWDDKYGEDVTNEVLDIIKPEIRKYCMDRCNTWIGAGELFEHFKELDVQVRLQSIGAYELLIAEKHRASYLNHDRDWYNPTSKYMYTDYGCMDCSIEFPTHCLGVSQIVA